MRRGFGTLMRPLLKKIMSETEDQFYQLMYEIKYATKLVRQKKYTLVEYYDHMGDFFDYLGRPGDAKEHYDLRDKEKIKKGKISEDSEHEEGQLGQSSSIF